MLGAQERRRWRWLVVRALLRSLLLLPAPLLLKAIGQRPTQRDGATLDARVQFFGALARRWARPPKSLAEVRAPSIPGLAMLDARARSRVQVEQQTIPGPGGDLLLRLYRPRDRERPCALVVYYHAGGCVIGDLETGHAFCAVMAEEAGAIVVSVEYRLAPEHPFPAAVDDALAAWRWACLHAVTLGADPARLGVAGDSAGAYLAGAVLIALAAAGEQLPAAALLVHPVAEMDRDRVPPGPSDDGWPLAASDMRWFALQYVAHALDFADPRCSLLRAASFRGLPPTLLVLALHDPLYDEGLSLYQRLSADGVPVELSIHRTLPHAFTSMSGAIVPARQALIECTRRFGSLLNGAA